MNRLQEIAKSLGKEPAAKEKLTKAIAKEFDTVVRN
jgi:hypothetical protein